MKLLISVLLSLVTYSATAAVWTKIDTSACGSGAWCPLTNGATSGALTWKTLGGVQAGVLRLDSASTGRVGPPFYVPCNDGWADPTMQYPAWIARKLTLTNIGGGPVTVTGAQGTVTGFTTYYSGANYPSVPHTIQAGATSSMIVYYANCWNAVPTGNLLTTGGNVAF